MMIATSTTTVATTMTTITSAIHWNKHLRLFCTKTPERRWTHILTSTLSPLCCRIQHPTRSALLSSDAVDNTSAITTTASSAATAIAAFLPRRRYASLTLADLPIHIPASSSSSSSSSSGDDSANTDISRANETQIGVSKSKRRHRRASGRPNPVWTLQEDQKLYEYVQRGKRCHEVFADFPGRSVNAINVRMSRLRNTDANSAFFVTGNELLVSLKQVRREKDLVHGRKIQTLKRAMVARMMEEAASSNTMDINTSMSSVKSTSDSNSSNNTDRSTGGDYDWKAQLKQLEEEEARQEEQKYEHRNDFYHMPRSSRPWTPEEKKALEILVRKNRMRRNMWSLIAGSQVDIGDETTITLARTPQSCMRKWKTSHRPKHHLMGRWSESEVDRLKIALRSQIGSEHQLILNVRKDSQVVSTSETDKQDTKPPLKEGSFILKALDWDRIARVVGTRDSNQCYKRFYSTMTNGRKGPWSRGEIELLEEAFSKYSNQWKPVAAYIGSRSVCQVQSYYYNSYRRHSHSRE